MRLSRHVAVARLATTDGLVTDIGEVQVSFNLDESQSPYGEAHVTAALFTDAESLARVDPLTHRGLRMQLEMRESVGDGISIAEITADFGGSVSAITAAYTPDITPARITADYFTPWNDTDVRDGAAIRANLLVTRRRLDHDSQSMTFAASTDEALLHAYRLIGTAFETSGSTSVRTTVNYALAKIGAALTPGATDATITEADAILWEPGISGWDYVRGAAEAYGLVVRCDERRRWTLTERDAVQPGGVQLTALTAASEEVSLDDATWADAVVIRYSWPDAVTGASRVRYATSSSRTDPIKVVTVERDTAYPGGNPAGYWLKRLKARGRVFDLETVGDYTIRPGIIFTGSLPGQGATVGYIESITWSCPEDRGSIRTRGVADASANAIDLWPTGLKIDQLTGKIDALITAGV